MKLPLRKYWEILVIYLRPQWPRVALLGVLLFGNIGLQLINPLIVRGFIDTAVSGGDLSALGMGALVFISVALASQALTVASTYVSQLVGWTATNALRADLALHCLHLDMSFHNNRTPGEMIERIDGDVTALSNFFSQLVVQLFGNMVLMAGVIVMLFREDWLVGAVLALFTIVSMLLLGRVRGVAVPSMKDERQANAEMFGFIEERLSGLDDIRANGGQAYVMRRLFISMTQLYRKSRKAWILGTIMWLVIIFLFAMAYVIAFGMGAYLYSAGAITLGTVYLFVHYTDMLRRPVEDITEQMEDLQKASASIERVEELYHLKSAIPEGPGAAFQSGPLAVSFDEVSFHYDNDEDAVIQDLTFELQPGRVLGLLGRTGSGKTTLTRLLLRLYDPGRGAVKIGGVNLRESTAEELRARIGMVTQDVQLFNATLRDNLTLFDKSIPDSRILDVLTDIGLNDWYSALPDGLDTMLGTGGGLSAGEAQMLAFARVFLKDPGLVILDEASSRLDPATEHLMEVAVKKLLHNRTGIIIAHRLDTVGHVDEIMILENGTIGEHGPRERLARDPGSRFHALLRTGLEEALA